MGLLSSISSAIFDRSVARANPPSYFGSQSTYLAGPLYLDAFQSKRAPSGFELVEQYKSLIFACVQLNWMGLTRVPLKLYTESSKDNRPKDVSGPRSINRSTFAHLKRSGMIRRSTSTKDDIQEITEHPLIDALDHPDPEGYFSREDMLGLISAYCDVVGVAYLKLDPGGSRMPPSYIWPLQSQYTYDIKKTGTPLIKHYQYFGDTYEPEDVLRFRMTLSLRDPYGRGYSPTYAALQYAMLEDKFVAVQDQLLGLGPRPNLLVSPKDATMPITGAEKERYRQDLLRQHARGSAGGVLITEGAVDVNTLSYSPTDLSGLTLSQDNRERTCNCFGVPVTYFTKDTNLANLQAAESQHARMAIEPRCKAIAGTWTRLAKRYDERLFFAFDPCVEEDKEADARVTQIYLASGLKTINEERTELGMESADWGEEPWLPATLQQPSMAQEKHDAGIDQIKNAVDNADMPASEQFKAKQKEKPKGEGRAIEAMIDRALERLEMELVEMK